jgi:hypothetical protein
MVYRDHEPLHFHVHASFPLTSSKLDLQPCTLLIWDPFLHHPTTKAYALKVISVILQAILFPMHGTHPTKISLLHLIPTKNVIVYSSWELLIFNITEAPIMFMYVYYKDQCQHFQVVIFSHYGHYLLQL